MMQNIIGFIVFCAAEMLRIVKDKRTWIAIGFLVWTYFIGWLFNNFYFQSPVKEWQCMMCRRMPHNAQKTTLPATLSAELIQPTTKPLSEEEIVFSQPHGEILWKIYQLETQRGKTDGCRKNGKYGGFGVMVDGKVWCYDSFQEAAERAEYWLVKMNPDKDLVNALCTWNAGPAKLSNGQSSTYNNCSYYQSYLSL